MFSSIRNRLLITLILTIIIVGVISLIKSYQDARYEVQELFDAQLAQSARTIQAQVLHELSNIDPDTFQKLLESQAKIPPLHKNNNYHDEENEITPYGHEYERKIAFQVWDKDKNIIIHSVVSPLTPLAANSLKTMQPGYTDEIITDTKWRVFTLMELNRHYVIQVGEQYEVRDELTNKISRRLVMPSLISLPILAFMIWIGIGRGLAPLFKVTREVSLRAPDFLEPIVIGHIPTEIRPLAQALNELLSRLKEALEKERRFTDDAAHELRTPLAALKTQAQVALKSTNPEELHKALQQIVLSVDRASHLVQQMLTLARYGHEQQSIPFTKISLYKVSEEVLAQHTPKALEKNIELSLDGFESSFIYGEQTILSILFNNLVDNAIKYSPQGSKIDVNINQENNHIRWQITDEGSGIKQELQHRVFDRFYRITGNGTNGSGLGLAIAQQCASILKAEISINNASDSGGTVVNVQFNNI